MHVAGMHNRTEGVNIFETVAWAILALGMLGTLAMLISGSTSGPGMDAAIAAVSGSMATVAVIDFVRTKNEVEPPSPSPTRGEHKPAAINGAVHRLAKPESTGSIGD